MPKLSELPEAEQNRIIKEKYFKEPSGEGKLLLFLYEKGYTSKEKTVDSLTLILKDINYPDLAKKLTIQGQIKRFKNSEGDLYYLHYLSDEGVIVAEGIKKIYQP